MTPWRESALATVSHDLKDPLSTIMLAASFSLEVLVPADDAHQAQRCQLQVIARAALRMRRLVGSLLDASALEAGALRLDRGPHAVGAVLAEARDVLAPLAAAKGVALDVAASDLCRPDGEWSVDVDRDRLLQVFANLGGNAIKFTPAAGRVTLSATAGADARWVEFRVTDTGCGIASDDLPFVFDRFFQASATAQLGTGLGLTIAKGIVEAHSGHIDVSSVPGVGSTFRFTVPRRAAA